MVESKPVLRALVNGAGPTGALTALALADAGWQVQISDPMPAAVLLERSRAYAFTHSSQRLLEQLGLWPAVQAVLVPFRSLQHLIWPPSARCLSAWRIWARGGRRYQGRPWAGWASTGR